MEAGLVSGNQKRKDVLVGYGQAVLEVAVNNVDVLALFPYPQVFKATVSPNIDLAKEDVTAPYVHHVQGADVAADVLEADKN